MKRPQETPIRLSAGPADPTLDDLRQMVAAIAVGIGADDRTMAGLMQAAKVGWEYGSGRKVRKRGVRLIGS